MKADLHTHTTFSDGKNTPEETVLAAIRMGLDRIGISDHSYTPFDTKYCIAKERLAEYRETVTALKAKYRGQIEVLLGIEQDYFSPIPPEGYDYVIGSVHYFHFGDEYIPVDDTPEQLLRAAELYCGGDFYTLIEKYFEMEGDVLEKTHGTIVGHVDLIRKFNAKGELFDEQHPRYRAAVQGALDRLLPYGVPFERNTGAISRGYQTDAYPSPEWVDYIRKKGGTLLLSGDSHRAEHLCYQFDRFR